MRIIKFVFLLFVLSFYLHPWIPTAMEGTSVPPFEMPDVKAPTFPDRTISISDHGAVGDGDTLNTQAFAKAIAACAEAGGGTVLVPPGIWLSGAIHLRSNVNLHVQKGAVIRFSTNPEDYLPAVFVRWAGFECYNYSPLIYARDCTNIAITGEGKLDGQGEYWWHWEEQQDRVAHKLYDMVLAGVPVEDRVFGNPEDPLRPQFFQPINCKHVYLEDVAFLPGPFWTIQAVYCEHFLARGVSVINDGPNNDGMNMDSSRNVLIEDCFFWTGDDCIALKSGLNEDGWRVGRPTENIEIRNCRMDRGHGGVVIGSEMSGNVRKVYVHDCVFPGAYRGIRLKSTRGRGGVVEDIWIQDIEMSHIKLEAVRINTSYRPWFGSDTGAAPLFRNIHFKNITCDEAKDSVMIVGLPEMYIEGVTFENVSIKAKEGVICKYAEGIDLKNVTIVPEEGPVYQFENVTDSMIRDSQCPEGIETYLEVKGEKSGGIRVQGCDLSQAKEAISLKEGASKESIAIE